MEEFIQSHLKKIKPLLKEARLAHWKASISGNPEEYKKLSEYELKIRGIYSNHEEFLILEKAKKSKNEFDSTTNRQINILFNNYLENQIDPQKMKKIVIIENKIEENFSTFRASIQGKKVTNNEIEEILKSEKKVDIRKEAWLASKKVGNEISEDIIELINLRNQAAQNVGFDNYHDLSLSIAELDKDELDQIFSDLHVLTNDPFEKLKREIDGKLAQTYKIKTDEIKPWHYHDPFFQETPPIYELNLDNFFENIDVKELAIKFYNSIGLDVVPILKFSDLYEKEGKNPHAFCTDIDREGDVRVLCNLKNNERWMETILHELGHAVYDKYQQLDVPYLLRTPAHIFTTEAIAMLFGRLSKNADWVQNLLGFSDDQRRKIEEDTIKYSRLKQLVFTRWAMVMYNFEKQMYENTNQNLNDLWWRLVEKYQFVSKPEKRNEADWAAKIHFAIAPCYYHNYMLGELLASQLNSYIVNNISTNGRSYVNQKKIGSYLIKSIFEPAAIYHWNEMIHQATGEKLNPKYYVTEFV